MIKKKMRSDRWSIPVPAEYSKAIGLELSSDVYIHLNDDNKYIIISAEQLQSPSNLDLAKDNKTKLDASSIINTIERMYDEDSDIKDKIIEMVLKKEFNKEISYQAPSKLTTRFCSRCNAVLSDKENLMIDGERICSKCKKEEVVKFIEYMKGSTHE